MSRGIVMTGGPRETGGRVAELSGMPGCGTPAHPRDTSRRPREAAQCLQPGDNLFHTEKHEKFTASFDIANITNKVALYNFLSTFSGTHFLQPRTIIARVGLVF